MNKMKKMLAIASAAAMLCGSAATMNVSAAGSCDVNGDGEVSTLDVLTVNQYLMGVYYLSDPSVLDVNVMYNADSDSAQGGGPVYLTTSYRSGSGATTTVNTVVAINSMGNDSGLYNQGTRINSELIMFYKNNENNTYE